MAAKPHALISALNVGFNAAYQKGLTGVESQWSVIATKVPSKTSSQTYGWLGNMPRMREWVGDRVIQNISNSGYSIKNKKFESTIGVEREAIDDDEVGIYVPLFEEFGQSVGEFVDEQVFGLLERGHQEACYDGQNFFDAEHPVYANHDGTGTATQVSNLTAGEGVGWYVLDCSRVIKPIIWQERDPAELVALTMPQESDTVFMRDEYLYGSRLRGNVGFGFWQMAHKSHAPLDADSLWDAIQEMRKVQGDGGKKLGIKPTHLVVPPELEKLATRLLERELDSSSSNELKGRLTLLVADYL